MDDNKIIDATEETAIATREQGTPPADYTATMWNDATLMRTAWKTAQILASTNAVPDAYKNKPGDCLIAMDLANRMGLSPVSIMQYSQVVKGNFTWKGQACKALVDGSGRFVSSEYITFGEEGTMNRGCYLEAISKATGNKIKGPAVTMQMAKDEGWLDKAGSKWKTMPELMLKYRAAAFFARTECPETLMGFYSADEMNDIKGYEDKKQVTVISLDN